MLSASRGVVGWGEAMGDCNRHIRTQDMLYIPDIALSCSKMNLAQIAFRMSDQISTYWFLGWCRGPISFGDIWISLWKRGQERHERRRVLPTAFSSLLWFQSLWKSYPFQIQHGRLGHLFLRRYDALKHLVLSWTGFQATRTAAPWISPSNCYDW